MPRLADLGSSALRFLLRGMTAAGAAAARQAGEQRISSTVTAPLRFHGTSIG